MGAPTDNALRIARDIEAQMAAIPNAGFLARIEALRAIAGVWRLASRLDYHAADQAIEQITAIQGRVMDAPPDSGADIARTIPPPGML